jgi:DNA-binding transcriptional ArsR family regulator
MLDESTVGRVFHALADETRRALVEQLSRGPASVTELARPHDISLAAVLQHLQVLERSGLVRTEKAGRVRSCRLDAGGLSVVERWIQERRSLWERRLDRLGEVVSEGKPVEGRGSRGRR